MRSNCKQIQFSFVDWNNKSYLIDQLMTYNTTNWIINQSNTNIQFVLDELEFKFIIDIQL